MTIPTWQAGELADDLVAPARLLGLADAAALLADFGAEDVLGEVFEVAAVDGVVVGGIELGEGAAAGAE